MTYELYLRQYGRDGVLKNAVVEPLFARFTDSVNNDGPLVFGLHEDSVLVEDAAEFDIFEAMLRNKELGITDFEQAFVGILRHWDLEMDDDGLTFWQFTAPHPRHVLSWRHVLWPAGENNRSDFQTVEAETIMKTVVQYNFTADASEANGRQRDGDLASGMGFDVSIATDQGRGNILSLAFQGANVLDVLQKLAERAGGDFDLAWQGSDSWEFEFYPGQLGADKSSGSDRVLCALANKTMSGPRLRRFGAVATVAMSGGQGEGSDRAISEVEGPDFAANYDIETFVDARNESSADGREFRGAQRLDELKVVEELTFDVLQTGDIFYSPVSVTGRKTYKAGDLVLARYAGVDQVRKITSLRVDWQPPDRGGAFQVDVTTQEVSGA